MCSRPLRTNRLCAGLAVGAALTALLTLVPEARADDMGVWASQWLWVDFKKPDKAHGFQLGLDLQQRAWGTNLLSITRPGLGYDVGHGISLWAGYAFIPSLTAGTPDSQRFEHRVWEQIIVGGKVKNVALQGRARLEQRFRPDAEGVGERLRLFARAGFFFGARSEWGWAVWDEVMLGLNTTQVWNTGFDQNRAFTGPFFQSPSGVRVEFGYMNLLANRKDVGLVDSHIAIVNLLFLFNPFRSAQPATVPPAPALAPAPVAPDQAPPPAEQPPPEPRPDPGMKSGAPAQSSMSPHVASDLWDAP
jgi:hypothetical protein